MSKWNPGLFISSFGWSASGWSVVDAVMIGLPLDRGVPQEVRGRVCDVLRFLVVGCPMRPDDHGKPEETT